MTNTAIPTTIAFDCVNAFELATFWAAVAGGTVAGDASPEFAMIERPGASDLTFNQVPEGKAAKNRVHLDLTVDDLAAAVAEAANLGAEVDEEHDGWTILRDPEGNEFCLMSA